MKIKIHYLIFTSIFLFTSCSKEPEYDFYADFYSNANTSATTNDLIGTWAIFNIEFVYTYENNIRISNSYKIKIPLNINKNLLIINAVGGGENIQVEKI